jgi:homoserine kinase
VTVGEGSGVEIEGEGASELPRDASHLTLRAFSLFMPLEGHRFTFVNRVPLERGLGSSAAAIALGLVAGAAVSGRSASPAELLALGEPIERHDNLAAAFGGVAGRRRGKTRVANRSEMPAAPILAVPTGRTLPLAQRAPGTGHARGRCAQRRRGRTARRRDRAR